MKHKDNKSKKQPWRFYGLRQGERRAPPRINPLWGTIDPDERRGWGPDERAEADAEERAGCSGYDC